MESRNAKFLENDLISGSDQFRDIVSEKDHYEGQPSGSSDRLIVIHVDRIKTHIQIYDTITKGLLSNPWQRRHKTC